MIFRIGLLIATAMSVSCASYDTEQVEDDLWLEEISSNKSTKWVDQQNQETLNKFGSSERFIESKGLIMDTFNSPKKLDWIKYFGDEITTLEKTDKNPLGILKAMTLEESKKPFPVWRTVLDYDKLSNKEGKELTIGVTRCNPYNPKQCLVYLSESGQNKSEVREFDLAKGEFVEGGFVIPSSKTGARWYDKDTLLLQSNSNGKTMSKSGLPLAVKKWKRGQNIEDAELILAVEGGVTAAPITSFSDGKLYTFIGHRVNRFHHEFSFYHDNRLTKLDIPPSANLVGVHRGIVIVSSKKAWTHSDNHYKADSLVGIPVSALTEKEQQSYLIFEPNEGQSIIGAWMTKSTILVNLIESLTAKVITLSKEGTQPYNHGWATKEIKKVTKATIKTRDTSRFFDEAILVYQGFLTPNSIYFLDLKNNTHRKWQKSPSTFDVKDLSYDIYYATGPDGVKIPYQIVGPKVRDKNKRYPTIIYAYGSYGTTRLPWYRDEIGLSWLSKGGVFVIANVRGGGVYGDKWHKAAIKTTKYRSVDDLVTVAKDMIDRKITTSKKVGVKGGSMGGLLACAAITSYPEVFNAAICRTPLTDLMRYTKYFGARSWITELGDPDIPEERAALSKLSPYHSLKKEVDYPSPLMITFTNDDIVHPSHARRFTHKMRELGKEAYLYEGREGGHRGPITHEEMATLRALEYEYFAQRLMNNE